MSVRKQMVEPVFGIIQCVIGFRQVARCGIDNCADCNGRFEVAGGEYIGYEVGQSIGQCG
jgi:hypothetical protein